VKPAHAIDGFHPVGLIRLISISYATLGRLCGSLELSGSEVRSDR